MCNNGGARLREKILAAASMRRCASSVFALASFSCVWKDTLQTGGSSQIRHPVFALALPLPCVWKDTLRGRRQQPDQAPSHMTCATGEVCIMMCTVLVSHQIQHAIHAA